MDRTPLRAEERTVLGKNVAKSRRQGLIPANVYGRGFESEAVFVKQANFQKTFAVTGETGLIDLKIGDERTKPVLVRDIQYDARRGEVLHIDFYQVNLKEKVRVWVPIELIGEEPEQVHLGEAVVLNPVSEIEIEALPDELIDKVEVDITVLKQIDDAVTVADLRINREVVTVITPEEEVVIKMAPAVTQEMQQMMEEQEAEAAAAAEEATEGEEKAEGEEGETEGGEEATEGGEGDSEEKSEE